MEAEGMLANRIVIATRGSKLALIQTEWVSAKLREFSPGLEIDIEVIKTSGDKIQSVPFAKIGSMGIFVKEIENAVASGNADLAVHSLKDVQTEIHPDLTIAAMPEREGPRDALVSRDVLKFDELPDGSVIGTSSARRRGLIAVEKRDFEIRECRGNLPTRIEKLRTGEFDAVILAEAGLRRMGMGDLITEYLDITRFIPAVGQGALGIEIRRDDERIAEFVKPLNHQPTFIACTEEREFLGAIGGGCHAPIGAHMYYREDDIIFLAYAGTCDGSWYAKRAMACSPGDVRGVGLRMADDIKAVPGSEAFFEEVARDAC